MKQPSQLIALIFSASLFATGTANAAGHMDIKQCDKKMHHMMEKLDLSKQQHHAIKELKDKQHQRMAEQHKQMKSIKQAIKEQVKSESFDAAKVRRLAEQKAEIMIEMTVSKAETMHQIRHHLTEEQRHKMEALKKEHHGERHHKH